MAEIPTPAFAVPYAAPKQVKTMADVQPIAPKNGYCRKSAYYPHTHPVSQRIHKFLPLVLPYLSL